MEIFVKSIQMKYGSLFVNKLNNVNLSMINYIKMT